MAPIPVDEADRLLSLHRLELLDTPDDDRFDVFTRLAAGIADTPIAAVSLVDTDRQWFKSAVGLDVRQTPRDQSFCAHAILTPQQPFVVPDARCDPRFADNPLVTGDTAIRFYAGVPVVAPDGQPLGALCVIDTVPRRPDPLVIAQLIDLARALETTIALHAALKSLGSLAATDRLTGLANEVGLRGRLAMLDGTRDPAALLLLDLDQFHEINELFGHRGGDAALIEIARRLESFRAEGCFVARPNEDEFAVLAPGIESPAIAQGLAARLHAALARPFTIEDQPVALRASIGGALFPGAEATSTALIGAADAALAQAKKAGRGVTRLAEGAESNGAAGRHEILSNLRCALIPPGREPFILEWQPVVEAGSLAPVGFEALIRWPRPGLPRLGPNEFIPVAERHGLITHLDRWVMRTACAEAVSWATSLTISVNLSAANLYVVDIVDIVRRKLETSGLDPKRLQIEVTESVIAPEASRTRAAIDGLRALGVRIALDDFGARHASLAYVRDFPFDAIKIDAGFIRQIGTSLRADQVAHAVVGLGQGLGVPTTAEGVETEEQLAFLRAAGVTYIQGWLTGRPGAIPEGVRHGASGFADAAA